MNDSVIIIPTYNEKENIGRMIDALMALEHGFDVLVVDDGSPDGTASIVREAMAQYPGRVHMIERSGKLGLGTAYVAGFKWSLQQGYEYIFEMDADFSHDPKDVPLLYEACAKDGYDLSVGSRYVTGVNVVNWPMGRVLMSYFASKYVRFITRLPVYDTTAGFNCYRRKVLETIDLDGIRFKEQIDCHDHQIKSPEDEEAAVHFPQVSPPDPLDEPQQCKPRRSAQRYQPQPVRHRIQGHMHACQTMNPAVDRRESNL